MEADRQSEATKLGEHTCILIFTCEPVRPLYLLDFFIVLPVRSAREEGALPVRTVWEKAEPPMHTDEHRFEQEESRRELTRI